MKYKVRNCSYAPNLEREGLFLRPLPTPPPGPPDKIWSANLKPHERLYYHQTLSSVRQCKRFIATPEIPRDSLDFKLQSRYNHSHEVFPALVDAVMQHETCPSDPETFRLLRNTRTMETIQPDPLGHPLKVGGILDWKKSPHSVKLINSGPHTQLVNNGYSRQPADGNFFRY